jgi:capsule polysaccharide export protein KpsE/RkpR
MAVRRALTVAIALVLAAWLLYVAVSWFMPVTLIRTLLDFPETLWNNLPHVPGLGQATRDVPAAIKRTEEAQAALREQAAAANSALAQAKAARFQVSELKRQLAQAQADLAPLRARQGELEGDSRAQAARVADLERALAVAGLAPVSKVTTRQQAVDALRKAGY